MGSVRERGERWYVSWKDATGTWRERVTTERTKSGAKRLVAELEHKAERQRHGLEAKPTDCKLTLGELCETYLADWCSLPSRKLERYRLTKHILRKPIAEMPLPALTTATMEAHLRELETSGLAASSVNHVRAVLRSIFTRARKLGLWAGMNPMVDTDHRRVPRRVYDTLTAEEALLVLPEIAEEWRGFFAAALFLGLRKGECAGIRKSDVNVEQGTLTVRASYDSPTTKGRHADVIPIPPLLMPFIAAGLLTKGAYLFPAPDGSMRRRDSAPQFLLRRALARAGLVLGWDHVCRRCKAAKKKEHTYRHVDAAERRCPLPECGMRLWPKALVRPLRFHDLRHTHATLLFRAGVDSHRVQRLMRHNDVSTTTGTYSHLEVEDLRGALNLPWQRAVGADMPAASGNLQANGGESVSGSSTLQAQAAETAQQSNGVSDGARTRNIWSHSPVLYH